MKEITNPKVFGPVPSRRLGLSLGIINVPGKTCTYSCSYCQAGATKEFRVDRSFFYEPADLLDSVVNKIRKSEEKGDRIDYLSFVPDGEPTLDMNIGKEIDGLASTGKKIAVITNGSLLWKDDVKKDLMKADLVSIKIDSVDESIWKQINAPAPSLKLDIILKGIKEFASQYKGILLTETMLLDGKNESEEICHRTAAFIASLNPYIAYISIPTRPVAHKSALVPDEKKLAAVYDIFSEKIQKVEYLLGYEGNDFPFAENIKEEILAITTVHPIRYEGMLHFLKKSGSNWDVVYKLMDEGKIVETLYRGKKFYMRKHPISDQSQKLKL